MDIVTSLCQENLFPLKLHKNIRIISRAKDLQLIVFAFIYARQTILYYPAKCLLLTLCQYKLYSPLENYTKVFFHTSISLIKKPSDSWTCEGLRLCIGMFWLLLRNSYACGVLFWNCTAIKSTFHRAMKPNGRNSDCKGKWRHDT